ncbi:DUF6157 family protein [Sphingoaurantiacus capsulatus]|uniref:DUF6157 family protein n=1 Tax=Sphingoaurantiacus capsulatus TaxID=1771310 RepID=A0ABV7XAB4_9SPHN
MSTTNYANTFIAVSPDSPVTAGDPAPKPGSVAAMQLELLQAKPYGLTSDDLLFEVHAGRADIAKADRAEARARFFSKPQACLRASPLVKKHGWGIHHDAEGRVAAVAVESDDYAKLKARTDLKQTIGMRSAR